MTTNSEKEPEQPAEPPPSEPDEGFETQTDTRKDDPGEGFETERVIKAPKKETEDRRSGEGFEIERQT
jgi:hypothetical protein